MGCDAVNFRLAVAKSKLASSYLVANIMINDEPLVRWARRAKCIIKHAYEIALKCKQYPGAPQSTCLILADMKRIMALSEEYQIVKQVLIRSSQTYGNRLHKLLEKHVNLLHLYEKSYKPNHPIIATALETIARIYTHLIQHEMCKKNFEKTEHYYNLTEIHIIKSIDMKEKVFGKNDVRVNYRFLGECYLHRIQDLADKCEFEKAEELFRKSIRLYKDWMGEYDCRLGVAYAGLGSIYARCGLDEEVQEMQQKWTHWSTLQQELEASSQEQNHRNCLTCPNFACIKCYSCICQTKLTVKRLDEFEDFSQTIKNVYYSEIDKMPKECE